MWEIIGDPQNDPRWCDKVKAVAAVGDGRWTAVHKPLPLRPAIELAVQHQEVEAPHRLKLREEDQASVFDVEYRLEPSTYGTRLTQVSRFEWKSLPRVLRGPFAHGVRRDVRNQLRALKRLLEG